MSSLSPKERLLNAFARKSVDRKPVICPGGMMNAAIVEVMDNSGRAFPEAHGDAGIMTELALAVNSQTGFENIGIPFCMTVEAEALGSAVDFGTRACEPKIAVERFGSAAEAVLPETKAALSGSRSAVIASTVEAASRRLSDVPVIGSLTGPISTAGSLVDPMRFLKDLRKDAAASHALVDRVADFLIEYAYQLIEAGADVISIADPTATGEILGPKMFEDFAVRYINRVADGIHCANVPVIVHICGDLKPVRSHIAHLHADAVSADAMVDLVALKAEFPELVTMGNLSTYLLEFGTPEKVAAAAENLRRGSIDIIAPACGLSTSSPLANIRAFTDAIKA